MKVINLFGAPGSGKSTLAAGLFHEMKLAGYNVELVTEYAKDMVWEERYNVFQDQIYILGKQNRRLLRLKDKVDYVVTDSPILLGVIYMVNAPYNIPLEELIEQVFDSYDNTNIYIERSHQYEQIGRNQSEEEAQVKAQEIKGLLDWHTGGSYITTQTNKITPLKLMKSLGLMMTREQQKRLIFENCLLTF